MVSPSADDTPSGELTARAGNLQKQANDIDAARKALDDAAGMARGLWIGFISLSAYLAVAVGSVTHRMLFLEEELQLPIVDVKLPLVAFFWIAPILFLVLHAYLLLHLKFTGDSVREWERLKTDALRAIPEDTDRAAIEDRLRMQMPNFLMVQMLVPPKANSSGFVRWALTGTVLVTVIVGPVLLLALMQLQFLPYHSEPVTWVHRLAIAAELILIGLLWPLVIGRPFRQWHRATRYVTCSVSAAVIWLSIVIAAFPGERMYRSDGLGIRTTAHFLFEGSPNEVGGRPNSWFSNRLVLSDQDFVDLDDDKLAKADTTQSLRGRHLERGVFSHADLRKSDFTGAHMAGATFTSARLEGAKFECALTGLGERSGDPEHSKGCADLRGAALPKAELQGAKLDGANLSGASLEYANLQAAFLQNANLIGASIVRAKLQGAALDLARLQGASMEEAELQGATLAKAKLQGASLRSAHLQGASLRGAELYGAVLDFADLQGASLIVAKLEGASLYHADLRGTLLGGAEFQGASLIGTKLQGALVVSTNFFQSKLDFTTLWTFSVFNDNFVDGPVLSVEEYKRLLFDTLADLPVGDNSKNIIRRLAVLDPSSKPSTTIDSDIDWARIEHQTVRLPLDDARLDWLSPGWQQRVAFLRDLACAKAEAPHLARRLVISGPSPLWVGKTLTSRRIGGIFSTGPYRPALARYMLNPQKCPGAVGIGPTALASLDEWATERVDCELSLPGAMPGKTNESWCFRGAKARDLE